MLSGYSYLPVSLSFDEDLVELVLGPGFVQRRDADPVLVEHRLPREHRKGSVPEADRVDLVVPLANHARQKAVELRRIDRQRRQIPGPGPIRHDRPVDVEDVRQLARQRRGGHRVIVGGLWELLDCDLPVALRGVEVADDPVEDVQLHRVAGAVVPERQLGLRGGRRRQASRGKQDHPDPGQMGHGQFLHWFDCSSDPTGSAITESRQRNSPRMRIRLSSGGSPRRCANISSAAASPILL